MHVKSVHAEQHYSCDQCEYKATQKRSLKTHVESIHKESCSLNDTVVQMVYIKDDQVSGLNAESNRVTSGDSRLVAIIICGSNTLINILMY